MGGKVSSLFQPLHLQSTSISSLPPRFRPRRAKGTIADSSMDVPGYWGDAPFAFGAEEAKGSGQSLSPHPPTVTGCQTQAPETSVPFTYSPWPAQSRVPRRGQSHLNFFFNYFSFYLPAQPGAMESRRKNWAVFLEMLL